MIGRNRTKNQNKLEMKKLLAGAAAGTILGISVCGQAQAQETEAAADAQLLLEAISQEKLEEYLDEHPEGSEEDARAQFQVNEKLNQAAAHRLEAAQAKGYTNGRIPDEGTINQYLTSISYQGSRTCMELYLRNCEDGADAYGKFEEKMMDRYEEKEDRKYLPEYYREIGMAQACRDGKYDFLIILMR